MAKIIAGFVFFTTLVLILSGCNGGSWYQKETLLDKNWGRSYEQQKYGQIIDHEAGSPDPVEGMAGDPVTNTVEKYNKSFEGDKKQETINILKLQ